MLIKVQLFSTLAEAPPPTYAELPVSMQLFSVPLKAPPPRLVAEFPASTQLETTQLTLPSGTSGRSRLKHSATDRAASQPLHWTIHLQADPAAKPLEGPVLRIAPSLDPTVHTLLVMGRVDNPGAKFVVGVCNGPY